MNSDTPSPLVRCLPMVALAGLLLYFAVRVASGSPSTDDDRARTLTKAPDATPTEPATNLAPPPEPDSRLQGLLERAQRIDEQMTLDPDPTPDETDPEWELLPRGDDDLVAALMLRPEHLDPKTLFRHQRLNREDRYLPAALRAQLEIAVLRYADLIRESQHLYRDTALAEFQDLVDRGEANWISREQTLGSLPAKDRETIDESARRVAAKIRESGVEVDPEAMNLISPSHFFGERTPAMIRQVGDKIFSAAPSELPRSLAVMRTKMALSVQLTVLVTTWFETHVDFPPADGLAILQEGSKELEAAIGH